MGNVFPRPIWQATYARGYPVAFDARAEDRERRAFLNHVSVSFHGKIMRVDLYIHLYHTIIELITTVSFNTTSRKRQNEPSRAVEDG